MHWLLEPEVFGDSPHPLARAAQRAGHGITFWRDEWWSSGALPEIDDERVVFHGSLGNAARIVALGHWSPGAYCNVEGLRCSAWYPLVAPWRLNARYVVTTVRALCERPREVTAGLGRALEQVFVRPDGPLKPFGGRVVTLDGLAPQHLDHGFYYDDLELPVVVAPFTALYEEWRFVVVHGAVVGSSGYQATGRRTSTTSTIPAEATALAKEIAAALPAPDPAYVLDLARTEAGLRLVELNPFSGSDLYGCDRDAIVAAVAKAE